MNRKSFFSISCSHFSADKTLFQICARVYPYVVMGKGHYYENQNVEKQPKRTSKISVFLVHHYYENQNVEKNEKNIESLIFV